MSDMLTRCPQCSAAFRLTSEQFSAAQGMVRCGSCLHVFKADEHWVHPANSAKEKEQGASTENTQDEKSGFHFDQASIDSQTADDFMSKASRVELKQDADDEDDIDASIDEGIDENDDDKRYSDQEEDETNDIEATPEDDDFANIDDLLADTQEDAGIDEDEDEDGNTGEEWAKGLLDELEDVDPVSLKKQEPASGDSGEYAHFEEELEENLQNDIDSVESDSIDDEDSFSEKEGGYSLDASDLKKTESDIHIDSSTEHSFDDDGLDDFDDLEDFSANLDDDLDADNLDNEQDNQGVVDKLLVSEHSNAKRDLGLDEEDESDNKKLLLNIEPEPVEVSWNYSPKDLLQPLIWGGLCLLMAGLLVGQYAYYNYDHLSKENDYRPLYQKACEVLGCKLPEQVDRSLIKTQNLVVRSHPAYKNVLVVDAILVNTANFVQPYPPIELFFNDTFKIPIASRRFTPEEYLAGEVAADSMMPVSKSIHITLEVMDPGEKAVSYLLEVSRHQTE